MFLSLGGDRLPAPHVLCSGSEGHKLTSRRLLFFPIFVALDLFLNSLFCLHHVSRLKDVDCSAFKLYKFNCILCISISLTLCPSLKHMLLSKEDDEGCHPQFYLSLKEDVNEGIFDVHLNIPTHHFCSKEALKDVCIEQSRLYPSPGSSRISC